MTGKDALHREIAALEQSMFLKRFNRIGRTGRLITALTRTQYRGERVFVNSDQQNKREYQYLFEELHSANKYRDKKHQNALNSCSYIQLSRAIITFMFIIYRFYINQHF